MKPTFLEKISKFYNRVDRRGRVLVLTIHRVGNRTGISGRLLRQYFSWVRKHYEVVLPFQLQTDRIRRPTAIISVDDCHEDVYHTIYPIARELGLSLTICVPTDFFLHNKWLWFDKVQFLFDQAVEKKILFNGSRVDVNSLNRKKMLHYFRDCHPSEFAVAIEKIYAENDLYLPENPVDAYRPVERSDMLKMLDSGMVEITAHTVSHSSLKLLDNKTAMYEIVESRNELIEFSGRPVASFCYPNGLMGDFNERTRGLIAKAGFRIGFTSIEGINYPRTTDLLELKRIHVHKSRPVFYKLASGLGDVQKRYLAVFGSDAPEPGLGDNGYLEY